MPRPIDGVRVADLTRLLPGAYATQLLADLGAEVIKIEDPRGGDGMRRFGPRYFDPVNRGKRSVTLDLRSPEAAPVLDALVASCDVVVDSFRPSTARRLRVDAETRRANHPRLICASIVGFDRHGPRAEIGAHDINYRALAGTLNPSTGSGRGPFVADPLVADIGAAMQAAIRILAALVERQRTGAGCAIDVTIHGAATAWAAFPTTGDLESACYTLYETSDGQWLALGALEPKFWRAFCERLGRPEFLPLQHARAFDEIRAVMRSKTRDEWCAIFEGVDACLTPVLDRSAEASRAIGATERQASAERVPTLGADTDAVLAAAGIDDRERARLRAEGVI